MKENWFEIAWINNDEAILHGHKADVSIRVTLTIEQRDALWDMNERHCTEMQELLGSFVQ